jgi:hypothetical protein
MNVKVSVHLLVYMLALTTEMGPEAGPLPEIADVSMYEMFAAHAVAVVVLLLMQCGCCSRYLWCCWDAAAAAAADAVGARAGVGVGVRAGAGVGVRAGAGVGGGSV